MTESRKKHINRYNKIHIQQEEGLIYAHGKQIRFMFDKAGVYKEGIKYHPGSYKSTYKLSEEGRFYFWIAEVRFPDDTTTSYFSKRILSAKDCIKVITMRLCKYQYWSSRKWTNRGCWSHPHYDLVYWNDRIDKLKNCGLLATERLHAHVITMVYHFKVLIDDEAKYYKYSVWDKWYSPVK